MPLRETRRFKNKRVVVSFGDIMLPLVGVVAIALLVVAGKLFFFSGLYTEKMSLPVLDAGNSAALKQSPPDLKGVQPAEVPVISSDPNKVAPVVSEEPRPQEPEERLLPQPRREPVSDDVLAIPYGNRLKSEEKAAVETREKKAPVPVDSRPSERPESQKKNRPKIQTPEKKTGFGVKVVSPRNVPRPPVKAPEKPSLPAKKEEKPKLESLPSSWQVQVGAFSSRPVAEEALSKLSKAGYKAEIVSGPKFQRVLVQAGTSRQDAASVAVRLNKLGFAGAFPLESSKPRQGN